MRIRKNNRNLPVEGVSLPKHSSFLVCQLNRSPWDDDLLFSQFVEEKWDDSLNLNRSTTNFTPVSDRGGESMEVSFDYMGKQNPKSAPILPIMLVVQEEQHQIEDVFEKKITSLDTEQPLQSKQDGHLSSLEKNLPLPPPSNIPTPTKKRRGRPSKHTSSTKIVNFGCGNGSGSSGSTTLNNNKNNNSDVFYYYSGFGPNWGKKRGENKFGFNNTPTSRSVITYKNGDDNENVNDIDDGGNSCKNVKEQDQIICKDVKHNEAININNNDNNNNNNNNGIKKKCKKMAIVAEKLIYINDELQGGKRVQSRKPIKARSLKSLM